MILKFTDKETSINYYLWWSSVVDAPTGTVATEETLDEWAKNLYPYSPPLAIASAVYRARENGSSASDTIVNIAEEIRGNRAGEDEAELTVEEIIARYCRGRKDAA